MEAYAGAASLPPFHCPSRMKRTSGSGGLLFQRIPSGKREQYEMFLYGSIAIGMAVAYVPAALSL
jgi:hypothetical protein